MPASPKLRTIAEYSMARLSFSSGGICRIRSNQTFQASGDVSLGLILPGENLQVSGDGFDAAVEVRQVELLVRRVQIVVGESEAHHDAGDAEVAVEDADD